jgi:hypothetical protein
MSSRGRARQEGKEEPRQSQKRQRSDASSPTSAARRRTLDDPAAAMSVAAAAAATGAAVPANPPSPAPMERATSGGALPPPGAQTPARNKRKTPEPGGPEGAAAGDAPPAEPPQAAPAPAAPAAPEGSPKDPASAAPAAAAAAPAAGGAGAAEPAAPASEAVGPKLRELAALRVRRSVALAELAFVEHGGPYVDYTPPLLTVLEGDEARAVPRQLSYALGPQMADEIGTAGKSFESLEERRRELLHKIERFKDTGGKVGLLQAHAERCGAAPNASRALCLPARSE